MATPQPIYSDHARLIRLRRFLTWLAATIAIVIAVAVPVIYLLTAHKYETLRVERAAQDLAETVSGFVYSHPDLWEFSTNRLEKILLSHAGDEQLRQLIGPDGDIIAASQSASDGGALQTPYRLSIEGSAEVFNGQIVIGTIRVAESLSPVLIATGWIAVFGALLAIAVFVILRALPLRALDNALNHLQSAHADLRDRVARHEKTEAALMESEERFRSVVNNSPTKIHIKDLDGRYLLINSEAEKLFGVSQEEVSDKTADEIFPQDQAKSFAAHDRAVLATGQTIQREEEWLREDGIHTFLTVKFPILDGAGSIAAIGAIGTDITERKRTEEALLASEHALQERVTDLEEAHRKLEMQGESMVRLADDLLIARDEARAADRAKSEFLAAMSHELRTPMNAVLGFSEIIKDETFGPVGNVQYRDYAKDIHDSGKHLLGLINDILDLSKIESGTDDLCEDNIEISKIIRSALKLVGQRAEQGAVKLELELQDQLPALRADERKLKQILVNLLSNAIKFSDAGGEVAIWVWCRKGSGHVFQIIDTGIGIAPEDIPNALSRFGQIDAGLNRQYEGTGLGLPLTKALVERHGGTLDLQSQVGVGTTVTVRFPAERVVHSPRNSEPMDTAIKKAG